MFCAWFTLIYATQQLVRFCTKIWSLFYLIIIYFDLFCSFVILVSFMSLYFILFSFVMLYCAYPHSVVLLN
ncbi:hypothetical protein GIB67_001740 [Kingdonia uniflora]|uniref:Uncharacterized protein n=1 Tax=Kingdonia uniflora TaxID=39325 RepID=A0A7J7LK23_9MAGN|nr:hypothetical protein GIB67_001740 [Kingdonia uniflora]